MAVIHIGLRQYLILRTAAEGSPDAQRPLTQIEIHRVIASTGETADSTYKSLARLRSRGLVRIDREHPDPRATVVHVTAAGRAALAAEQARMVGAA